MNLKSKIFGTLAASAIALSITAGASAAEPQAGGHVNLAPGSCYLTVGPANHADFGSWTWNGAEDEYKLDPGSTNSATIQGTVDSDWDGFCRIGVRSAGLSTNGSSIPPNHIKLSSSTPLISNYALTSSFVGAEGWPDGTVEATLTLDSIPDGASPEQHTGVIEFQISNGA